MNVSIHAPREGSDIVTENNGQGLAFKFQSTPPVRGATAWVADFGGIQGFQSTPPVRGATFGPAQSQTF